MEDALKTGTSRWKEKLWGEGHSISSKYPAPENRDVHLKNKILLQAVTHFILKYCYTHASSIKPHVTYVWLSSDFSHDNHSNHEVSDLCH